MDLETITLSDVSQREDSTDVRQYCMALHICRSKKKKWYKLTYLQNRNRLTESENELLFPDGKGREEGMTGSYGLT